MEKHQQKIDLSDSDKVVLLANQIFTGMLKMGLVGFAWLKKRIGRKGEFMKL